MDGLIILTVRLTDPKLGTIYNVDVPFMPGATLAAFDVELLQYYNLCRQMNLSGQTLATMARGVQ